jgi:hypothetical protein
MDYLVGQTIAMRGLSLLGFVGQTIAMRGLSFRESAGTTNKLSSHGAGKQAVLLPAARSRHLNQRPESLPGVMQCIGS